MLGILVSFAFALDSETEDRFDPCLFIDCTNLTTSTKAPVNFTPKVDNVPKTEVALEALQSKLVCTKSISKLLDFKLTVYFRMILMPN